MEESEGGRCDSPVYPCPSFNSYSDGGLADVASRVCREEEAAAAAAGPKSGLVPADFSEQDHRDRLDHGGSYDDDDDDFEFVPLVKTSDQVFIGRYTGPVFPVFNRDLMSGVGDRETVRGEEEEEEEEESERSIRSPLKNLFLEDANHPSCSSSEADELESVPEGTYCVWTPRSPAVEQSPARCKKSNSTGSCSKRWRFRDLLRRSNSEGKDSFVFLAPSSSSAPKAAGGTGFREKISSSGEAIAAAAAARTGKSKAAKEKASASAHETFYVRNRALKEGDRRRSYLPYRKDLVGFFANVNGMGRRFPPF